MIHDTADPCILLVHGFWHGAWCWGPVQEHIAAKGRRSVAIDLPGHGLDARRPRAAFGRPFDAEAFRTEPSPVADITLEQAADRLARQIESCSSGRPVVLAAASFGGVVASRAAELVPHLVDSLVYVAAVMPSSGVPGAAYLAMPEQDGDQVAPLLHGDPRVIGALRLDAPGTSLTRERLRNALYGDLDQVMAGAAIDLLTTDAPANLAGPVELTTARWGSIPRTYVRCTEDNTIRPRLQGRFIADADRAFPDNPTRVITLRSSHSPFLSQPERVAEILLDQGLAGRAQGR